MLDTVPNTRTLEARYGSGAYVKRDLTISGGEGALLYDAAGRAYIDCVSGHGASNLGHGYPAVVRAIQQQAAHLIGCPELFHNDTRARYQAALCEAAQMSRVFLCNSGTEAVEGALKLARVQTGRPGIIAAMRGFHGRTMGALSTTWHRAYREPFAPLVPHVRHVPYNNLDRLAEALDDTIAAVILEPIQGEGGIYPADDGYLAAVQELCRANGSLLILDEVQTGFGRTGWLFAHQRDGVQPDVMCLAKSIAGGLPMGAVLFHERAGALPPGSHGSTFGGNPLACAVGMTVLNVLQNDAPDLITRARTRGTAVIEHLRTHLPDSAVRDVRGRGFMIGIELRGKVAPVLGALQDRGVLALPAGRTVLRLLPPLVITDDQLWTAVTVVEEVLHDAAG